MGWKVVNMPVLRIVTVIVTAALLFTNLCLQAEDNGQSAPQERDLTLEVLQQMVGKKVEFKLKNSLKIKGKLLGVNSGMLEIDTERKRDRNRIISFSEIESIKREGKTSPLIYVAVGLFGYFAFAFIVAKYYGD